MSRTRSFPVFGCMLVLALLHLTSCAPEPYRTDMREYREKYLANLLHHPQSPLTEASLEHIAYFRPDRTFVVTARLEREQDAKPFEMPTYSGTTKPYVKFGTLTFSLKGRECTLSVYQQARYPKMPGQDDYLFLPFKDNTNDITTYGGGRYLDMRTEEIANGTLELDFNKAYNPWCAYADGYRCPVPPLENHLDVSIEAGEKAYKGPKKPAG